MGHTWYLSIDMQLYVISPLVLFWVLSGSKKTAWAALTSSLVALLVGTTAYNFLMEFPSSSLAAT
jgi:peptidoglycan/LPS O-acetylase OafA/YrhL